MAFEETAARESELRRLVEHERDETAAALSESDRRTRSALERFRARLETLQAELANRAAHTAARFERLAKLVEQLRHASFNSTGAVEEMPQLALLIHQLHEEIGTAALEASVTDQATSLAADPTNDPVADPPSLAADELRGRARSHSAVAGPTGPRSGQSSRISGHSRGGLSTTWIPGSWAAAKDTLGRATPAAGQTRHTELARRVEPPVVEESTVEGSGETPSSKAMRLLTNAGETPSSSATAAKPARRATSIKTRKSFSSGKLFMIRVLCFTSYGD